MHSCVFTPWTMGNFVRSKTLHTKNVVAFNVILSANRINLMKYTVKYHWLVEMNFNHNFFSFLFFFFNFLYMCVCVCAYLHTFDKRFFFLLLFRMRRWRLLNKSDYFMQFTRFIDVDILMSTSFTKFPSTHGCIL